MPVAETARPSLRILPSDPTISIGASLQLRVSVEQPGTTVTLPYRWVSSDNHVATVNQQGLLRGVDTGTAIVTVTSYEGMQGSVTVEVR